MNSPAKLEKLQPSSKRTSLPSKGADIYSQKSISIPKKSILKPLANIRKEERGSIKEIVVVKV